MIDSNTYNEMMRIGRVDATKASYSATDVDNSPVKRQTDNSEAEAELSPDEKERRHKEAIAYVSSPEAHEFYKILRRHECNPFNAHFYDKEPLTEDEIKKRVKRASDFFDLPIPTMVSQCETLAKITFSDSSELGSEIQYDVKKLYEIGINNLDAFDAMLTHELSHHFLATQKFNFCHNKQWCIELACDFIVGVRCSANMIASGKYKYAVSTMKTSATHPDGSFRLSAVKSGFDFAEWLFRKNRKPTAMNAMLGLTRFLIANSKALNKSYFKFLTTPPAPPEKPCDIMDLPDSNLIKQAVLKYRAEQERKNKDGTDKHI